MCNCITNMCPHYSFGYSEGQSLILGIPSAVVAGVSLVLASWFAGNLNNRALSVIFLIIPTIIGGGLMAWLPADNKSGLLAGVFLINTVGSTLPLLYSWVAANCECPFSLPLELWLTQYPRFWTHEKGYYECNSSHVVQCRQYHW